VIPRRIIPVIVIEMVELKLAEREPAPASRAAPALP
jgi:hypothetical protein